MKHPILYLPIEIIARELVGKALLAAKAVDRGWLVVTGQLDELQEALFRHPPGAYFEQGIQENRAKKLANYKSLGHRTINLDEENIVYLKGKDYCQKKMGRSSLAVVDLSFTSGERNDKDVREFRPEGARKYRMVGNPRFDTLLPGFRVVYELEAQKIRSRLGRFLLFNSSFTQVNHRLAPGTDYMHYLRTRGMIENEEQAERKRREIAHKGERFEALKAMLAEIAKSKYFDTIVVRPHPSEDHEFWREWSKTHGVTVCFESNANAWMLAADAILHAGCTTGIEGLLLDRPIASFVPDPDSPILNKSDEVSFQVRDAREFVRFVEDTRYLAQDALRERLSEPRALVRKLICNVDPPLSSDRVLDALEELDLPRYTPRQAGFGAGFELREKITHHFNLFDQAARATIRRRPIPRKGGIKFPGLTVRELEHPIRHWHQAGLLKCMPTISKLRGQLFLLSGQY